MARMMLILLASSLLAGCAVYVGEPTGTSEQSPTLSEDPGEGWPPLDRAVIRPGVGIQGCTGNFIFRSPDNQSLYIGTAAHCGNATDYFLVGDRVELANGKGTGTVTYSSFRTMEEIEEENSTLRLWNDFTLILVDEADRHLVHPAMHAFGGPTGMYTSVSPGDHVLTYGQSPVRENVREHDARQGFVTEPREWSSNAYFATASLPGDSGSPVITANGEAIGVLKAYEGFPRPASNHFVHLDKALEYAHVNAGVNVTLVTWPFDGWLPS